MQKNYVENYNKLVKQMGKLGALIPGTMEGFSLLHKNSTASSSLDKKTKELIALGIAITVRCDGCIAFHVHDSMKAGASKEELVETIGVAVMMGGGPSVVYGCEALEAIEQFKAAQ